MTRWQRHNQTAAPPYTQPQAPPVREKRDGHLQVYWKWPLLVALTIDAALFVAVCGVSVLIWLKRSLSAQSFDWQKLTSIPINSLIMFFVFLLPLIVGAFLYAGWQWQGPRGIESARRGKPKELPGPPRVVPWKTKKSQALAMETEPPKTEKAKGGGILSLFKKEEDAPAWCKEMYRVLMTIWPSQDLTRASFERLFGGPRYYYKYVAGKKGNRGHWDNWGVIAKTGRNNSWEFCENLPAILAKDPALRRYAERVGGVAVPRSKGA
jgi:hypothetical protein